MEHRGKDVPSFIIFPFCRERGMKKMSLYFSRRDFDSLNHQSFRNRILIRVESKILLLRERFTYEKRDFVSRSILTRSRNVISIYMRTKYTPKLRSCIVNVTRSTQRSLGLIVYPEPRPSVL